ncbi:MAG: hypothetical protein IIZ94_08025, partial [Prevotella sp.]|nr:hypothetical protein [Prevotella sp.]
AETIAEVETEFDISASDWGVNLDLNIGNNTELDADDFNDKIEIKFSFTIDENAFVLQKLAELDDSKEAALLKLLGYE